MTHDPGRDAVTALSVLAVAVTAAYATGVLPGASAVSSFARLASVTGLFVVAALALWAVSLLDR